MGSINRKVHDEKSVFEMMRLGGEVCLKDKF